MLNSFDILRYSNPSVGVNKVFRPSILNVEIIERIACCLTCCGGGVCIHIAAIWLYEVFAKGKIFARFA